MSLDDGAADLPVGAGGRGADRAALMRYFARFDEGEVIRWAFRGLLLGAIGVLSLDLLDLSTTRSSLPAPDPQGLDAPAVLPPAVKVDGGGDGPTSVDPRENLTGDEVTLRAPMTFALEAGGLLVASGYIDPGAAARFEAELAARGEYVTTVLLNSPGGSLDDALRMAGMIRDKGLATEVGGGALCASSCPLVLAGGTRRTISPKAAVGVHQFYSVSAEPGEPAQAMADAQSTTARISRHLAAMGVDPALWLHALDTPPRSLYYLSADEMRAYRLASADAEVQARKR